MAVTVVPDANSDPITKSPTSIPVASATTIFWVEDGVADDVNEVSLVMELYMYDPGVGFDVPVYASTFK